MNFMIGVPKKEIISLTDELYRSIEVSESVYQHLLLHAKESSKKSFSNVNIGNPYKHKETITDFLEKHSQGLKKLRRNVYELTATPEGLEEKLSRETGGPIKDSYKSTTNIMNTDRINEVAYAMAKNKWTPEYLRNIVDEHEQRREI